MSTEKDSRWWRAKSGIESILEKSRTLLDQILRETDTSAKQIVDHTNQAVATGTQSVQRCEHTVAEMLNKAEAASSMSEAILQAYQQQELGLEELGKGMTMIDQRALSNGADSTQARELAEGIAENSRHLGVVVHTLQATSDTRKQAA